MQHPPTYFKEGIEYHCVDLIDTAHSKISPFFEESSNFISKTIENGSSVLVHCSQGVSRSASLVIAYLVMKQKFTLENAFNQAKKNRCVVNPNKGFCSELISLEKSVHGKNTVNDISMINEDD